MVKLIKKKHSFFEMLIFIILILYSICLISPLIWGFVNSFKGRMEAIEDIVSFPKKVIFQNYADAFINFYKWVEHGQGNRKVFMPEMYLNSLIYAGGSALASTFCSCIMAYATARYRYRINKYIYSFVIVALALPIVGALPASINLSEELGIFDKMIGPWIMNFSFINMYYFIFYSAYKSLSKGYGEAAKMDGANPWYIFVNIYFPLVRSTFLTVYLIYFISYWNDYQMPMLYLPNHPVLAYGMYYFSTISTGTLSSVPMKLTGSMLLFVPIFTLFILFRKRLMINLSIGGMKE